MPTIRYKGIALCSLPVLLSLNPASVWGRPVEDDIHLEVHSTEDTVDSAIAQDDRPQQSAPRRGVLTFLGQSFRGGAEFSMFGAHSTLDLGFRTTRALLYGDNGTDRELFFVANSYSSTRITADLDIELSQAWFLHFNFKIPLEIESSNDVDFGQGGISFQFGSFDTERHADIALTSLEYGKWYLGFGSTASDESAEVDLSGTTVIASSKSRNMAGGLSFNNGGPHINDVFNNFDGLGDKARFRYDTPEWNGYELSASVTVDDSYDVAVRYQGLMDDSELHAAVAYAYSGGDLHQLSASSSLRTPEGLSTTLAAAARFDGGSVPLFFYGKLAYQFDLFSVGATAFGVDFTYNRSVGVRGDDAINYGVFGVQNFVVGGVLDSADLYIGFRNHHLWLPDIDPGDCTPLCIAPPPADSPLFAAMAGFRLQF